MLYLVKIRAPGLMRVGGCSGAKFRGEDLARCMTAQSHREAVVVVSTLPGLERDCVVKRGNDSRPQNSSSSMRWLRSILPFCSGRRGVM
jgi:hypothetical protein